MTFCGYCNHHRNWHKGNKEWHEGKGRCEYRHDGEKCDCVGFTDIGDNVLGAKGEGK